MHVCSDASLFPSRVCWNDVPLLTSSRVPCCQGGPPMSASDCTVLHADWPSQSPYVVRCLTWTKVVHCRSGEVSPLGPALGTSPMGNRPRLDQRTSLPTPTRSATCRRPRAAPTACRSRWGKSACPSTTACSGRRVAVRCRCALCVGNECGEQPWWHRTVQVIPRCTERCDRLTGLVLFLCFFHFYFVQDSPPSPRRRGTKLMLSRVTSPKTARDRQSVPRCCPTTTCSPATDAHTRTSSQWATTS